MKKKLSKHLKQNRSERLAFLAILFLYGVFSVTKFTPGIELTGILLLFYFPGKFLIELLPPLQFSTGRFGKLSLSIIYSFCLNSILSIYTQSLWGFNSNNQIWAIIGINATIFLAHNLLPMISYWKKIMPPGQNEATYKISPSDYIPIIIFFIAIAGWIIASPLAQNADNFLGIFRESVNQNFNLLTTRRIFLSFLELSNKFTAINDIIIYRYVPVALFFAGSLSLYDYLRRNLNSKKFIILLYLSFLAPAVILTEINNIRTQVIILALAIPVLILQIDSLKKKKILPSLAALAISGVSALFHELGFILFTIAFITTIIHLYRLILVEKKITWKYILLFLVIIYPYIRLVDISAIVHPLKVIKDYSIEILSRGQHQWRWWFLNRYIDADGVVVSFSGKNLLLYYLYNGILPLALFVYLFILSIVKKCKLGIHFIPPFLYFLFFFCAAEIFPRFSLDYLPSRAWVHIMIATVILLALVIEENIKKGMKFKFFPYLLIASILIGYFGSIYVARTNIKEVYSEELSAADFIKNNLPKDSLVLSSQYNIGLVMIYGNQTNYDQFIVDSAINKDEFDQLVSDKLIQLSKGQIIVFKPKIVQTMDYYESNLLTEKQVLVLQNEQDMLVKAMNTGKNPVYFVYSYRKLEALNAANQNRQDSADPINKDIYTRLGYSVVYNDKNVLIIRIR